MVEAQQLVQRVRLRADRFVAQVLRARREVGRGVHAWGFVGGGHASRFAAQVLRACMQWGVVCMPGVLWVRGMRWLLCRTGSVRARGVRRGSVPAGVG